MRPIGVAAALIILFASCGGLFLLVFLLGLTSGEAAGGIVVSVAFLVFAGALAFLYLRLRGKGRR